LASSITGVVVDHLVARMDAAPMPAGHTAALSVREREVLQLIAEGNSTRDVAERLHLSVKTVEAHRRQIMERLGVYTVAGLVKSAVRDGLVSLDD
ncbi:MAG: response regulator transcription factor, partial [Actinobacteria bacterium]